MAWLDVSRCSLAKWLHICITEQTLLTNDFYLSTFFHLVHHGKILVGNESVFLSLELGTCHLGAWSTGLKLYFVLYSYPARLEKETEMMLLQLMRR